MSVFISDKDTTKRYVQFLDQNTTNLNIRAEWVDLYQRFWGRSKNSLLCIIRFKNSSVGEYSPARF